MTHARGLGLLSPLALWLTAGFLLPLAVVAALSLQPAGGAPFDPITLDLTLEHYTAIATDSYYLRIVRNTLLLALGVTVASVVLGLPVALWIAGLPGKWRTLGLAIVLVPLLTNVVVRSLGVMLLLAPGGIVARTIGLLGIPPPNLLFGWFAVGLALTQVFLPFLVMTLYDGLISRDRRLDEAAGGLGAGPARRFFTVTLPLAIPGLASGITLVFLLTSTAYVSATLLGGRKVFVTGMLVYQEAMSLLNYPFASALAMVMLAASVLATLAVHRGAQALAPWRAGVPRRAGPILPPSLAAPFWRVLDAIGPSVGRLLLALGLGLLLFPMLLVVVASVNDVPQATVASWHGFTWRWYGSILGNERYRDAFFVSVQLAAAAVGVGFALTLPAAWALARSSIPAAGAFAALFMLPLALPGIAKALGWLKLLQWFVAIPPFFGLLMVHVVLITPFMLAVLRAGIAGLDRALEEASSGLGAPPARSFRTVVLPQLGGSLASAGIVGFLISFGEVTVTAFLVNARMQTLPVRIYAEATFSLENTVNAVSTLIIAATVGAIMLLGRFASLDQAWRR